MSSAGAAAGHPRIATQRFFALDRSRAIAAALGALTVAGFAPLYFYPLPIFTLAVLMWMWRGAGSPKRAAALGWWFGAGLFVTGVSWVYVSLHTFGAMPAPLAALFTALFCAYLAIFPALTAYCFAAVRAPLWVKLTLVTPAAWTLTEWVRSWLFTGFPWLAIGYSQIPASPLAGFAPVAGIYALSFATVATAGILVLLATRAAEKHEGGSADPMGASATHASFLALLHPALAAVLVIWIGGYGLMQIRWTEPTGAPINVTLLQGNIPQDIKWTVEGLRRTLIRYRDLTLQSHAKLIVFPETAIPLFLDEIPQDYLALLAEHARANGGDILIGAPERLPGGDYYNSAVSFGASPSQVYRKTHLVPFGEFIPLRPVLGWVVATLAIPLQDFSRGGTNQQPLNIAGERVALNICYEDVFGEEIIRQLPAATVLVNVSNVAWFGHSIAPSQHLQISQARALETGRYMLRATNTGMTGVVNERGSVLEVAPQFSTAAVSASVQGYSGATPYVRFGNAPALALCVLLLGIALAYARLRR